MRSSSAVPVATFHGDRHDRIVRTLHELLNRVLIDQRRMGGGVRDLRVKRVDTDQHPGQSVAEKDQKTGGHESSVDHGCRNSR